MMRQTFRLIPPAKIVQSYVDVGHGGKTAADALWHDFGKKTITVMQGGAHLVALLWDSAWQAGDGDANITDTSRRKPGDAMKIVADRDFLPSTSISQIGKLLAWPGGN